MGVQAYANDFDGSLPLSPDQPGYVGALPVSPDFPTNQIYAADTAAPRGCYFTAMGRQGKKNTPQKSGARGFA